MTTAPRCNVVTPVFRDVESFLLLRQRIAEALDASGLDIGETSYFVVDDTAGNDPEIDGLCELPDVVVVRPPFNLGHQRAIVAGLRSISDRLGDHDVVVTMDADGEDRPEDLPRLVGALLDLDDDRNVVLARRTRRKESPLFRVLYLAFRLLFRMLTGREVRTGNFAAYRGIYAKTMLLQPSFDLCYSSSLITLNPDPVFVPCPRGDRYAGQSRMGLEKLLIHGVRMLMPFADRIAIRSLAVCTAAASLTVGALLVLVVLQIVGATSISWPIGLVLFAGVVVAGLALVNFLVLFSGFAQTSALSLARVDQQVVVDD